MNPDGPASFWIVLTSALTVLLLVCLWGSVSMPVVTVLTACWLALVAWLTTRE